MPKKVPTANLTPGEVAKRSGVKISTLHYYEEKELIHAIRNAGNQRRYSRGVLRRIAVIKAAQKVGVSLKDIQQALSFLPKSDAPTKSDWNRLSQQWTQQLNQQINQLIALRDNMTSCIGCGCLSLKACPLYNPNDELGDRHQGAVLLEKAANK